MGRRSTWRESFSRTWSWGAEHLRLRATREESRGEILNLRWWSSWWTGHPFDDGSVKRAELDGEVVFPSTRASVSVGVHERYSERGDVSWNVCVPPIALYVSAYHPVLARLSARLLGSRALDGRTTNVAFFDGLLMWKLWAKEHEWSSTTPRWRDGSWNPMDAFFGRAVHTEEELDVVPVEVPMPEGVYLGTCTLKREAWTRPGLWFFPRFVTRGHIEMKDGHGVPHPGKGESSYDCGEDATSGLTCPAESVAEAVGKLVASVLGSRERHGGRGWRPDEGLYGKGARPIPPGVVVDLEDIAATPGAFATPT